MYGVQFVWLRKRLDGFRHLRLHLLREAVLYPRRGHRVVFLLSQILLHKLLLELGNDRLPQAAESRDYAVGPLRLDTRARRAWVDGAELNLTALEFDLLRLFVENMDTALSRERILNRVWGQSVDPLTNVVDVYIGRLRRKLESTPATNMLQTVRGVGYRLSLPQAS